MGDRRAKGDNGRQPEQAPQTELERRRLSG
jgi:hypothetical protein